MRYNSRRVKRQKFLDYLQALRINQWLKNLVVFTAVIFSGQLFNGPVFWVTAFAFVNYCLLSSASYLLNDIIDYPYDRRHPVKKHRPIASGKINLQEASFVVFVLTLVSLIISLFFSLSFFFLSLTFILLHFFYSLWLKKYPIIDIFSISFSFMIRAIAGEVASSYHVPIWLLLTIFFLSLFMATVKRHAEFIGTGSKTRLSLVYYEEHLLTFLITTFATMTMIAYAFYTYFERPPLTRNAFTAFFSFYLPGFEARRWLMISFPLVVYGIARYAQLFYEQKQGERPEVIMTQDKPLILTIIGWGLIIISLIYVL